MTEPTQHQRGSRTEGGKRQFCCECKLSVSTYRTFPVGAGRVHVCDRCWPESKWNTAAATAAVRRRGEETMAAKLRERGWTCLPPEGTDNTQGSHYGASDEPGLLDHLSAPPAKHVCGWRCPLPCPDAAP